VRRLLSFAFLLLFSFPLISPLLAAAAGSDANLPACCRRNGAHHCIGKMQPATSSESAPGFSAIPQGCPAFPIAITQARQNDLSFPTAALIFAEVASHPAIKLQTRLIARVALDRSHLQRGPPTHLL
jgi:hypothetical protein